MPWHHHRKIVPGPQPIEVITLPPCEYCAQHFEDLDRPAYRAAHWLDRTPEGKALTCDHHHIVYGSSRGIRLLLKQRLTRVATYA